MSRKPTYHIGIDPDTEKSGVAIIDTANKEIVLSTYPLPELIYELTKDILDEKRDCYICIESVGHTKRNFHFKGNESRDKSNAMGFDIGRCAMVQTIIKDVFDYHNIECEVVMPLKKCWRGKDGKITHEEITQIVNNAGFKFPYKRTNQEQRDALLLAWNKANLPQRIKY